MGAGAFGCSQSRYSLGVCYGFFAHLHQSAHFSSPLSPEAAIAYIDEWLDQPPVQLVAAGAGHWAILRNLLLQTGMAANLTTDAHIAALALEQGYGVYSADNDFRRFPGLKHINPLSAG